VTDTTQRSTPYSYVKHQTNTQYDKHNVTFDRRTIQFNSKTLFKDGDPVSSQLSSLGPSKHVNNTTIFHTFIQKNTG